MGTRPFEILAEFDAQQKVIKTIEDSQSSKQPITHVSTHVTDLRQLDQSISNVFKKYPNLTLIINFDTNQQTYKCIHGGIKAVKYLVIAGHNITTIERSFIFAYDELISVDLSSLAMLTTIENWPFQFCYNLTFIQLPQNLTTIRKGLNIKNSKCNKVFWCARITAFGTGKA